MKLDYDVLKPLVVIGMITVLFVAIEIVRSALG